MYYKDGFVCARDGYLHLAELLGIKHEEITILNDGGVDDLFADTRPGDMNIRCYCGAVYHVDSSVVKLQCLSGHAMGYSHTDCNVVLLVSPQPRERVTATRAQEVLNSGKYLVV